MTSFHSLEPVASRLLRTSDGQLVERADSVDQDFISHLFRELSVQRELVESPHRALTFPRAAHDNA